jgi:recombination protein RecA
MKKSMAADLTAEMVKEELDVALLSSEDSPCIVTEWLSSGCIALDRILGGGFPVGRVTEVYGDTSTGKSLIAAQVAALAQEDDHIVMMADSESAVSLPIMEAVGVDIDNLIYSNPDTVEEVFEQFEMAIELKAKKYPDALLVLIWDSVAATSVQFEMERDYGKAFMGRHAGVISQSMRKITRQISKNRICAIFLNQVRENIGVMFGDNETTFGGKAIPFHSSVRLRLKMGKKIVLKEKKKVIGIETTGLVVKNKVAEPFNEAKLPIYFGHGIDDALASLYWLQDNDIINKANWMRIVLAGNEIKFQKAGWDKIFDKYYDDIWDIIMVGESA